MATTDDPLHVTRLDRWLLRGRPPYRPAYLVRVVRLQYAFLLSVLILALFVGILFWSEQQRANEACVLRNQRADLTTKVLDQAAAAARADGDKNQTMVYRQLAQASRQTRLPAC